jgi:hypothetical protein
VVEVRKYEPKDFGLLDWVHYIWDAAIMALAWVPLMNFWTPIAGAQLVVWPTLASATIVLLGADKLAHYAVLPFLAKLMKQ